MLTPKQYELLAYIDTFIGQHGVSPSFDEMKEALNLKSKSGIHRLIVALEERGFLRRLPHRARALEVLRRPETMAEGAAKRAASFAPKVIEGDFAHELGGASGGDDQQLVELPLYGRIAAGVPIEALRDNTQSFAMPQSLLGAGEHYALEVEGDSMVEAGIHDGDVAVIRRGDTAENGNIVVALVGDEEVTLKRFRRRRDSIALEPANPNHETRIFGPDQVKVQGRMVCLFRRY
ncbi:MAG: transcriptional repressor LexA [Defluviicoccus sp.]|nr:transcriptional repressor LexA [Defluviicoccus sp.]MDE0386971.1 transcriptional repressor LexA [Defluviicoccus sp.]